MKTTFSISKAFKTGWEHTKNHLEFLALSTFVYFVLYLVLARFGHGDFSFILRLAAWFVSMLFSIGMRRIGLLIEKGGVPTYNDFQTDATTFISVLFANIIMAVFIFIGFILLIIPGIIVALRLSMTTYIILDKKMGAWAAVKESWKITKGHSWNLLGLALCALLICIVAVIPFGLGLIVALPFLAITAAIVYNRIKHLNTPVLVTGTHVVEHSN